LPISQDQDNMGLKNISDPRYLDLVVSQVQGNVGLKNMSNPRHLDLAVR